MFMFCPVSTYDDQKTIIVEKSIRWNPGCFSWTEMGPRSETRVVGLPLVPRSLICEERGRAFLASRRYKASSKRNRATLE